MTHYLDTVLLPFHYLIEPNQRIYWDNLFFAFLIGALLYLLNKQNKQKKSIAGLLSYLFPKQIYLHRSSLNDYLFFFTNTLLLAVFVTPLFSFISPNIADTVSNILRHFFPRFENSLDGEQLLLILSFTLILGVISDFAIFFAHYLQHRIPLLWEFHKVHHSAQVLNPITVYRMHPVDDILTFSFTSVLFGVGLGILQFFFKPEIGILNVLGTNYIFVVFYLFFSNLRHTHIWLSYGPFLSKIFISPAQHQIHHSMDKKHRDKNMGLIFAFWDGLFGTLYIPKQKENLLFGITPEENARFNSFWSLYLRPFINVIARFGLVGLAKIKNSASIVTFLAITIPTVYFSGITAAGKAPENTVFMENMTWEEVDRAIKSGATTVLVPTGGTEQNGPHLILGKHNYIVKYTAEKIAEKIGNTLIAPTIAYVPEGNIEPPEGHMRFAGTLSISESTFSQVLESTAKSLKTHGFKTIAFLGDSGGNQEAQKNVADRLSSLWKAEGVQVVHLGYYYKENGQVRYLLNEGMTAEQIGGHAGIRDTSELMEAYPEGVRAGLLQDRSNPSELARSGADGDARKAGPNLGKILLNLKVNAAVNQLKNYLNQ